MKPFISLAFYSLLLGVSALVFNFSEAANPMLYFGSLIGFFIISSILPELAISRAVIENGEITTISQISVTNGVLVVLGSIILSSLRAISPNFWEMFGFAIGGVAIGAFCFSFLKSMIQDFVSAEMISMIAAMVFGVLFLIFGVHILGVIAGFLLLTAWILHVARNGGDRAVLSSIVFMTYVFTFLFAT